MHIHGTVCERHKHYVTHNIKSFTWRYCVEIILKYMPNLWQSTTGNNGNFGFVSHFSDIHYIHMETFLKTIKKFFFYIQNQISLIISLIYFHDICLLMFNPIPNGKDITEEFSKISVITFT